MRLSLTIILAVLSFTAVAEDGLVVDYYIFERGDHSHVVRSLNSVVLMSFEEETSSPLNNFYVVKLRTSRRHDSTISLNFTLKDVIDGKPYYVGAKQIRIRIGESDKFILNRFGKEYEISLDTSYGKLPE